MNSTNSPLPAEPAKRSANVVLVVDDDEAMRQTIAAALRESGYEVLVAEDTGDAFRLADQCGQAGLDLLITDVVMPKMDGRDLARWMKGAYPKIKILFISGKPNHTLDEPGVLKAGADFLRKPFQKSELTASVRKLLES